MTDPKVFLECETCKGTGMTPEDHDASSPPFTEYLACPDCRGVGAGKKVTLRRPDDLLNRFTVMRIGGPSMDGWSTIHGRLSMEEWVLLQNDLYQIVEEEATDD